jgi:hypothetical protein
VLSKLPAFTKAEPLFTTLALHASIILRQYLRFASNWTVYFCGISFLHCGLILCPKFVIMRTHNKLIRGLLNILSPQCRRNVMTFNSQIKINKIFIKLIFMVYLYILRLRVRTEAKIRYNGCSVRALWTHPHYNTFIRMGNISLNYARSSGTRPPHSVQPHCTIHKETFMIVTVMNFCKPLCSDPVPETE